jgi:peptidyl-tRNA hydrolase, PTH2 family
MSLKQVILVRMDLKMPKGKLCVQSAHASVDACLKVDKNTLNSWRREGMKKVVLKVRDKHELLLLLRKARALGLMTSLITDAGKTFFATRTTTCGAIGPALETKIDHLTGHLKMV